MDRKKAKKIKGIWRKTVYLNSPTKDKLSIEASDYDSYQKY